MSRPFSSSKDLLLKLLMDYGVMEPLFVNKIYESDTKIEEQRKEIKGEPRNLEEQCWKRHI